MSTVEDRPAPAAAADHRRGPVRHLADVIGVGWVLLAAVAVMIPALAHGGSLGPFNYPETYGLSFRSGAVVHTSWQSDQITQMIPWSTLAWTQVHHGHLPLWNPYSGLGTPLAFNWQSSAFGLPTVLGYLFPLHLAYTAQVVSTIGIAGAGVYVLGRTLGIHPLGAALAGVAFELGGPFFGWVGWPIASVLSWSGWILAGLVLVMGGGRRRLRNLVLLAASLTLAVYAGQPDTLVLLGLVTAVVFAVLAVLAVRRGRLGRGPPMTWRPVLDSALAAAAAFALSAPLLLPGAQLISGSVRSRGGGILGGEQAVSVHELVNVFVGFDGVPLPVASAIGAVCVTLAVAAIVLRWRDPVVVALVVAGTASVLVSTVPPVITLMTKLPLVHAVRWPRALTLVVLVVAILAGIGLDQVVTTSSAALRWWLLGGLAALLVVIVVLAVAGPPVPALPPAIQSPLPAHYRRTTFLSEALLAGLGVVAMAALATRSAAGPPRHRPAWREPRRLTGAVLLVGQTAFLVASASFVWSSSAAFFVPSPAETALQRTVGPALVGLGPGACLAPPGLGVLPNLNVMLATRQMAVYDPILQKSYFASWRSSTGRPGGIPEISTFCPAVTSAAVARRYGIGYVLDPPHGAGPAGGVFVRTLGPAGAAERLYRIPGAAPATLTTLGRSSGPGRPGGVARPVAVTYPDPASWRVATAATAPTVLTLHLAAAPGWSATLDGRPLRLERFAGLMIRARIPSGRHVVVLRYLPTAFVVGLLLAAMAAVALVLTSLVAWRRRVTAAHGVTGAHGHGGARGCGGEGGQYYPRGPTIGASWRRPSHGGAQRW